MKILGSLSFMTLRSAPEQTIPSSPAEWRKDPFGWGEKHGFPKVEK